MKFSRISTILVIVLVLIAAAALSGCTSSDTGTTTGTSGLKTGLPDKADYSIQVVGGTTSPVTVTYADILAMDFKELDGISTVNSVGTVTTGDYIGVPLMSIVDKAGLPEGEVSFVISASDGYNMQYTKEQVAKSIVAFKKNGTPLKLDINGGKNAVCIVAPEETNNMWVKMPAKIEIKKGAATQPALSITGLTDKKEYLTLADLKALPQVNATFPDKNNKTVNVTGVALNSVLDSASIQSGATAAVFTGGDGYNKTVNLTDIRADKTALVAIDNNGTLKNYFTDLPFNTRVSNLTSIKIV